MEKMGNMHYLSESGNPVFERAKFTTKNLGVSSWRGYEVLTIPSIRTSYVGSAKGFSLGNT